MVASIRKHHSFIAVQQAVSLGNVVDAGRRTEDGVDQARVGIDLKVGLDAKVPLGTLLGPVHLEVALTTAVLGRTRCGSQSGIEHSANLKHQALGGQGGVDGTQQLQAKVVFFEQVAKPQDSRFVGQSDDASVEPCKLTLQCGVVQGFFHGRVRQAESLLL